MPEIMIRPAVNADIQNLAGFYHSIETEAVWQMDEYSEKESIHIRFQEARLPRSMKVDYPYHPEKFIERWRFFTLTLIACISNVPVGYVSVSTLHSARQIWIKDLVVDSPWRRKGIATALLRAVRDWGIERDYGAILLEMSSKNYPMIRLSRELGFQFSGYNDHFYNNGDIALFFVKQTKQSF